MDKQLTQGQWMGLTTSMTFDKVKWSSFGMGDDKVFGLDSFTVNFFRKAWDFVGPDVVEMVQNFFPMGYLLGKVNVIIIRLIPKVPHPETPS